MGLFDLDADDYWFWSAIFTFGGVYGYALYYWLKSRLERKKK